MDLIVMINNKGGVGKTTSAVNLAASFAHFNRNTLLVDLDPSASASIHVGLNFENKQHQTLCDFLLNEDGNLNDYCYATAWQNLYCLPSEPALSDFYDELQEEAGSDFFLNKHMFGNRHDIVLFDSPPNMGQLALNAMAIADYVLIPVQTQYLAISGLELTLKHINKTQRRLNADLKILGFFGTHYDRRTNVAKNVYSQLQEQFQNQVLSTVIGVNSKLIEAYNAAMPILYYAPSARGAREYLDLAHEILKRLQS